MENTLCLPGFLCLLLRNLFKLHSRCEFPTAKQVICRRGRAVSIITVNDTEEVEEKEEKGKEEE
jgi:hypothetical protein